MYKDKKGR